MLVNSANPGIMVQWRVDDLRKPREDKDMPKDMRTATFETHADGDATLRTAGESTTAF